VLAVTEAAAGLDETGSIDEEAEMTLTVLDPRTGLRVTISVPDHPTTSRQ